MMTTRKERIQAKIYKDIVVMTSKKIDIILARNGIFGMEQN